MTATIAGSSPSLLTTLRTTTATLHRDVERLPSMARLLGPLALDDYLSILSRLWRFHVAQEARLAPAALPPAFRQRPNVELLEHDLRGLSLEPPDPRPRASPAESLGMLYVLEGSALGGAVIARHVARLPALEGRTAFFARPALGVALRWRSFCALLAAHDERPASFRREVLEGAARAFGEAKLTLGDDECPSR